MEPAPVSMPETRSFGYKMQWLALRSADAEAVVSALGLESVRKIAWPSGVTAVYEDDPSARPAAVFVTPPVDGWVLAPHSAAAEGAFDLAALSATFGEAHRYATHRVVELQEWERWIDGSPVRRYGWLGESGEVRFNEGEPLELEAGLIQDDVDDFDDIEFPDEEHVMEVAGLWSVNPQTLDDRPELPSEGWLGYVGS